jgi:thiosulfate dehydrogenase (quinone) large subunit
MMGAAARLTVAQQFALVALRTLVGWHFAYEGYFKLLRPAWGRDGTPLEAWSAAGYLRGATGPLADLFHWLGAASWIGTLDVIVAVSLLLVGLSLLLGLFTRAGCLGALLLLTLFYVAAIPLSGMPEPQTEGAYLLVNKTLIEAAAVLVLLLFATGEVAGFDRWRVARRRPRPDVLEVAA